MKTLPLALLDIRSLKILGVTFSNNLSASDLIRRFVSESVQTLYALRVLRHHWLFDVGLQEVFRAVVVSELTYRMCQWCGAGSSLQRTSNESTRRLPSP